MHAQTMTFTWLPGTLTQVVVWHCHARKVLHIDQVCSVFGRPALDGLYLSGRYTLDSTALLPFESL